MVSDEETDTGLSITLTLRGDVVEVAHALAHGLPVEALTALRDRIAAELQTRAEAREGEQ